VRLRRYSSWLRTYLHLAISIPFPVSPSFRRLEAVLALRRPLAPGLNPVSGISIIPTNRTKKIERKG